MPVALSEKSERVQKENFAIRGLQFCGFIRTRRPSVTTPTKPKIVVQPAKPIQRLQPATIASLSKSTGDLLDSTPLSPPPPPYLKHSSSASSTSQGSLTATSSDDESAAAAAARRRSRRLSKAPPPAATKHLESLAPPVPTSPLARAVSAPTVPKSPSSPSPTTTSKPMASPTPSPSPSPTPPAASRRTTANSKHKSSGSVDSSGRSRPPVSGVRSASDSTSGHTYHYKRARASSAADASKRTQDAVLCLEALLDACQSGAVDDMRHVIEQVTLARKILMGDDDGVGLANGGGASNTTTGGEGTANASVNAAASGLSSTWIGKLGASSSVTSLATLSNLIS